jgi:hypothetical protein
LRKEIDENGHHVDSGKEIGGDGGSKELWLDVHASGSPNVSDDETQEDDSSDKEQGGDGGSEHEFSTHSDGFPGSVDEAESEDELSTDSDGEAESEDELPTNSDGGFHGSVDEMESIGRSVLQVLLALLIINKKNQISKLNMDPKFYIRLIDYRYRFIKAQL